MGAVVECVLDDAPPPLELRTAWMCKRWNCLPESGGLYEQDYRLIRRMNYTESIYNAVVRIRELKGKNIHQLTENERKILKMLMDNGLLFHA